MTRNYTVPPSSSYAGPMSYVALLSVALFTLCSLTPDLWAQDKKQEFAPKPAAEEASASPSRQTQLEPAGPRIDSSDALRRSKEATMRSQSQGVEQKLINLIKRTPDSDPKKPKIVDRLASFYWKLAGDEQDQAYRSEEECFERSAKKSDDIDRCADQRVADLRKAEEIREKAIEAYKYIVMTFPQFEEMDRILFALAFNFQQKQQNEDAKKIYTEMIQSYPESRMLADAIFNLADIFFATGDVNSASDLYRHVVDNYKSSAVYAYAVYKLGWCFYNQTDFQGALNQFIQVIDLQNEMSRKSKKKVRLSLKSEAQRDLIRVYVNIEDATASGGIKLIQKYAPERFDDLAERLADLYTGTGQFDKSTTVLRKLIAKNPKSYRVVGYQLRISENISNTHDPAEAIRSLKRLVSLWRSVQGADDADPKRVQEDRRGIERQLNAMARRYHNQALETKSVADFNTAIELYRTYIESFPEDENTYEMTFYYAEILYRLQKWDDAAHAYEKVLELNGTGQFTKDAAHGALLSYKTFLKDALDAESVEQIGKSEEQLQADRDRKDKSKRTKRKKRKDKAKQEQAKKPRFPKREIPQAYQQYLKASELYRKYVQESEYLVDIQYEEARVYYVFNHFERAVPLFKSIAEGHIDHRVAVYAANLLLECYNRMGDFDRLAAQVNIFVETYTPKRDAELAARLKTLNSELDFKKCTLIENQGEMLKAANCFIQYADKFSSSEIVDKALMNAAIIYDREKQMEKAIQARVKMINQVPKSPLIPKALYQIARNLQALAVYSQAAKAYEKFASDYPDHEDTTEALRLAAQFRLGLGELDKATENLKKYIRRLSSKDKKQAMVAYFELGSVLRERQQWSKMIDHYRSFTSQFKNVDAGYLIRAYTLTGNAYMNLPKRMVDHRRARGAYEEAVNIYEKIPKKDRPELSIEARSAVAEAIFKLTNYEFEAVKKVDFTKVQRTRDVTKHIQLVSKNITRLSAELMKIKQSYERVLSLNVESWGLAALAQIGQMFYFFFTTIEKSPPPRSFDYEMQEFFRGAMIQKADPLRVKAVESYNLCLEKALTVQWFNEWSDLAEKQLARINPETFRYSIEERAKPTYFHRAPIRRPIITALPEEGE